jgi:predicted RNA-binding protein YlxR (DUF448 family)
LKDRPGPVRTCLGCRARKSQAGLRRLALVRGPEGARVVWDESRTRGGRGAWLCLAGADCLEKALRKKVLARAFRLEGEADASALTPDGLATPGFLSYNDGINLRR